MTTEEQLRAALLGGGQLTSLLTNSRKSVSTDLEDARRLTSLPTHSEIAPAISNAEAWMAALRSVYVFEDAFREAGRIQRTIGDLYRVEKRAILSALEGAQWQSQRQSVFDRLETLFKFRERARVKLFLDKYFFLTPVLLEAREKIMECFGSVTAVLEVSTDPDNGNYEELWVRIQTGDAPADALSTLTRFDEEWWFDASTSSQNLLNIKLEYV